VKRNVVASPPRSDWVRVWRVGRQRLRAAAADGFRMLGERLSEALERTGNLLEVAVAYVEFAVEHRAYVEVMVRPDLLRRRPGRRRRGTGRRHRGARARDSRSLPPESIGPEPRIAGLAAWSLVHGIAELWQGVALRTEDGEDLVATVRAVARFLFDKREGGTTG
jgi:hypothetical protein